MRSLNLAILLVLTAPNVALAQQSGATGHFNRTFSERSPFSSPDETAKRFRLDPRRWPSNSTRPRDPAAEAQLSKQTFDVFVPPNYAPRTPHGILVWMGVTDFSPGWFDVLSRHSLIFVTNTDNRGTCVIDAVHNLRKLYTIDENRIYASGFSVGAVKAQQMVQAYPEIFRGGLFLMHSNWYEHWNEELTVEDPISDFSRWQGPLEQIKKNVRLVMMLGEGDRWGRDPEEARVDYQGLLLDGFERVSFIVVPKAGHTHPNAEWFEKGINALDHSPSHTPPTTAPTTDPHPQPGQAQQAYRLLVTADFWRITAWPGNPGPALARKFLNQILTDYPTTPAAIEARQMLEELDHPTTRPTMRRTARATPAQIAVARNIVADVKESLLKGNPINACQRLEAVVKHWPSAPAASEARKLLHQLRSTRNPGHPRQARARQRHPLAPAGLR